MKSLVYVTTRLPWPADNGRKVTLLHYCRGLHEMFGFDVHLFSFLEQGQACDFGDLPPFIKSVTAAAKVGKLTVVKNACKALFRHEPLQGALFQSGENNRRLGRLIEEVSPDVIVVDMIRLAPYLSVFSNRQDTLKVLDIDDLLSERYARQIDKGESQHALGTSARGVLGASLLQRFGCLSRLVLRRESRALKKAELKYASLFDSVFFVSEKEAARFANENNFSHVFAAGMGVDVDYYAESVAVEKSENSLSFVGNMSYGPNIASVEYIAREILPLVRHEVRLKVIGPCDEAIRRRFASYKGVELLGRLEDLRGPVRSTELYVAPISYGSGVKTKILEAMAMGMCVLTNGVGAEGISAVPGRDFFVEDDPGSMAVLIDRLLDDPGLVAQVGRNGQAFVDAHSRWDSILQGFAAIDV